MDSQLEHWVERWIEDARHARRFIDALAARAQARPNSPAADVFAPAHVIQRRYQGYARDIARQNPEFIANLIRNWMSDEC
jgi:flagellar biosynthesis/type III secretory pathway M-ring protein FliF/YscJ